ncbi:hypothetical protein C6169_04835 [Salmonella enterica]|uniref:Uncharacterized protein n=2 Tax=Salmonella enterica TaxID=28901 RepID=A0A701ULS4_SALER|nr:DUF6387 family protein [Salmonella enterica]EBV5771752.1 hypothetical protein [Salmonella enterica subsp. enterica serovar Monophasic]ECS7594099.1 hypothetical protein [Salmonella enterica subsp. enterica serovar Norwich]HAC6516955.1 hypothetical protein [Salmonella enterica subsp. salamae serovar 47:b:1,5]HAE2327566.1 hypothetical protein [Salmonella enterica subsp. diarizonae serovar 65:(k):z]EAM5759993.1 hypothetical protein [Salmonella enterica]
MTTQKEMDDIRTALSWFDVRRYDGLKDLTLEQIYAELERRMLAYKTRQQWDTAGKSNQMQAIYHEATIRCGDVILESKWISDNQRLSHSYAVRPMTRGALFNYGRAMYRLETSEQTDPVAVSSDYISEYLKQGGMNPANKMLIEIDLEEASSDDLAEHLKVLIVLWQKHLKTAKPPKRTFRFGHKTFQRILDYKVIPLMDLISWEQTYNEGKNIPFNILADILHGTDGIRSRDHIKDTDYDYAKSYLDKDEYFKVLNDFYIKNSLLKDWKITEVIKINDKAPDKSKK